MTEAKTGVIQSWARACLKPSKPGRSWEGFFAGSLALWHPDILNWTVLHDSPVVSDRSQMWSCVSLSARSKKKPVTFTLFSWTFRPAVQSNHVRSLLSQAAILEEAQVTWRGCEYILTLTTRYWEWRCSQVIPAPGCWVISDVRISLSEVPEIMSQGEIALL